MTSITVRYSRSIGDSSTVEGSVRVALDGTTDWQREWGAAYVALKTQVDAAADSLARAPEQSPLRQTSDPEQSADATDEVSHPEQTIHVGELVSFTGCRVMFDPRTLEAKGKRRAQVRMRIGNQEQISVGTPPGYVNAKSTEPAMMERLLQFREKDMIDVSGRFEEPWTKSKDGQTVTEYDLVVEEISRA